MQSYRFHTCLYLHYLPHTGSENNTWTWLREFCRQFQVEVENKQHVCERGARSRPTLRCGTLSQHILVKKTLVKKDTWHKEVVLDPCQKAVCKWYQKFSDKKSMNQILGKKCMEWILIKIMNSSVIIICVKHVSRIRYWSVPSHLGRRG